MTSVVLLDIDGTLVDYRTDLPASAAAAVRTARAGGHRVYLCTGRSRAEIYPELWQLGVDGLIGGNGSYVESSGEVIFHQVMDAAVVAEAIDWMSGDGLGYYLECNSGLFGSADLPQRAAAAIGRPGAEGEQFVLARRLRETDHAKVGSVGGQKERCVIAHRLAVVADPSAVGRAHFHQTSARGGQDVGDAKAAPDLHEFSTADDHLASLSVGAEQ